MCTNSHRILIATLAASYSGPERGNETHLEIVLVNKFCNKIYFQSVLEFVLLGTQSRIIGSWRDIWYV